MTDSKDSKDVKESPNAKKKRSPNRSRAEIELELAST